MEALGVVAAWWEVAVEPVAARAREVKAAGHRPALVVEVVVVVVVGYRPALVVVRVEL